MNRLLKTTLVGVGIALGLVALAIYTGLLHPDVPALVASVGRSLAAHTSLAVHSIGAALAAVPLVAKDPRALAFRAEAEALEHDLFDKTKSFTPDEVKTKADGIRALRARADAVAEFTPTAEIQRQGGDEELVRPGPAAEGEIRTGQAQAEILRKRAIKEFGSVGKMVMGLAQNRQGLTTAQNAVLADLKTLTRTIVGTTGDTSGGEFLLPLQQEASIFRVDNTQQGILNYARKYSVKGRTVRIPYLVQDQATGATTVVTLPLSGGIADITIVGEAVTKVTAQPSFAQRVLTAYKYQAYTEFGDEVLDDDLTGDLPTSVIDLIGQQVLNKMDDDCTVSGTGTAMPLAALHANNGALLASTRTGAGVLGVTDIFNLYKTHTFGPNSYWSISRYTIASLMALTLGSNTLVSWLPNLRDGLGSMPYLLGLPVRMNDLQPTLGTVGDIALINPDFYAVGIRKALTVDVSTHYQFRNDVTAYRFVARGGGLPLPLAPYAYRATGTTKAMPHSPFCVIAT